MRINPVLNIPKIQSNKKSVFINPINVGVGIHCQELRMPYYSYASFHGNTPSELTLVKEIAKNMKPENMPVLQKQYDDTVEVKYKPDFSIKDSKYEELLKKREEDFQEEFKKNTEGLYNSINATKEDKLKAVQFAYTFVSDKAKKQNEPKILDKYADAINMSVEQGHTVFADYGIKTLFKEAQDYWEQEYLPILLQKEQAHILFVEEARNQMPLLKKTKAFNDLSLEDKFFVAKYYQINNFEEYDDDPMTEVLKTHTIENKENLLKEIKQKIVIDTEIFNEKLNKIPELMLSENGIKEMANYAITGKNKDNETTLLKLLLESLNQKKLIGTNIGSILEYFKTLDESVVNSAIESTRKTWFMEYIPLKLEKEITDQAYKTNIHVKNNDELKKINKHLEQISFKLDNISISLIEYISNLDSVSSKFPRPVENSMEIQRNTGLQIEEMLSSVDKLTTEEEQKLMDAFKDDGSKYLDILLNNTKDKAVENMIKDLKTVIKEEKRPSMVLARLEGYATMAVMSNLLHGGSHAATTAAAHSVNAATGAAVTAGGFLSSVLDPHALALAAIVTGIYSIYSASQIHKEYSDMYFGGKI